MPRAHEYQDGAALLRRRGAALGEAAATYRSHRIDDAASGPVATAHVATMAELAAWLAAASEGFAVIAATCDARAEVCEGYAAQVREWERLTVLERLWTPRPSPPAAWAEA
jgi:hypothetical protein